MRFFSFLGGSGEKQEKGKSAGRENLGGKFMAVPEAPPNFEEGEMPTKEQLKTRIENEKAKGDSADLGLISFLEGRLENLE